MVNEIIVLKKEIGEIKRRVIQMEYILKENYEFSTWTKKELSKSRLTPKSKYISHKKMLEEFQ